ncbi:MAG: phospholipase D-like domain-containing protein [Parasphingorhabdus sp.]|uniref:phospholipase D-like domain-containing protein n=1 Tax=Parasphingorhabdus sp. TaxID=2709688 RepID=UPI00300249B8
MAKSALKEANITRLQLEPGQNCWRVEEARQASVIVDGEAYFRYLRHAMAKAKRRIILAGWDFDTRVEMNDTEKDLQGPLKVGDFIDWLVARNPDLQIYILRWDVGAIKSFARGSMFFKVLKWQFHPRIHLKLDGQHPTGAAQHHKIVAIDDDVAFCGGIDVTAGRWDTRTHEPGHRYRKQPNGEDHSPWHDASLAVQGPVATALASFAQSRWHKAGGKDMIEANGSQDCWPDDLKPDFKEVDIGIARTQPEMDDQEDVREIEQLYIDLIRSAKRIIYAESQYFASRHIAAAIAERLQEQDGPEIVVLNPISSEGWLEEQVMDTARARIFAALQKRDRFNRLRLYHPVNEAGEEIYVHAKIVIIDDQVIRIGSSNINNRSMGLDTECDLVIDAGDDDEGSAAREQISRIRNGLLAEHLGSSEKNIAEKFEQTGSLMETIQLSRKPGRTLRDYQVPNLDDTEKWLADNEILDPESPDEMFAGITKRGWFKRLG